MKTVKGLLTHAKCSGQDPYLSLLAYCSTPIDTHLYSPAEMLYQQVLCMTVPQQIGTLNHMPMLNMTSSTSVPLRVQTTTNEAATRNLHSLLFLFSMTPGTCGSLPP